MWRDQHRSGFDEAIYWLELLIKYGNFDHLKINDDDLNILQYLSVDVVCAYLMITLLLLLIMLKTTQICLSRISWKVNTWVIREGGGRRITVKVKVIIDIQNVVISSIFLLTLYGGLE